MIKTPPRPMLIAALIAFVLSCVLVIAYLWIDFGGTMPLVPQGYRIEAAFQQANELATGADVRIAGVNVGKVVDLQLDRGDNRTLATLQIDHQYAPLPRDTDAMLRIKTLLGETYVQLSYNGRHGGILEDGARIPDSQVKPEVALDQILATFDPKTRKAFATWVEDQGGAVARRGYDINASFGSLPGFFDSASALLNDLHSQSLKLGQLIANTGGFFQAVSAQRGQLSGFITASDRLFQTTASRNKSLAELFKQLPEFERQSRLLLPVLTEFGNSSDPVIKAMLPLTGELNTTFAQTKRLAPSFNLLFHRLGAVVTASKRGVPALNEVLNEIPSLLNAFIPFLRNANPMVRYISLYKQDVAGFFANLTAASQYSDTVLPNARGEAVHSVRASLTLSPESLAALTRALGSTRDNAYKSPGAYSALASGLSVLDSESCGNGNPAAPVTSSPSLTNLIQQYVYRSTSNIVAAPACKQAGLIPGFSTAFPHLTADPPPTVR